MIDKSSSYMAGKTALVTGAAKRLGRAVALELARRGANIVVHYRGSADEAEQTAEQARTHGVRAVAIAADLSDTTVAATFLPRVIEQHGPIDILVNSASIFEDAALDSFSPEDLHRNMDVNALAPTLLARSFAAQQRDGVIINFLDCMIVDYDAKHVAYHLSKRALAALTHMMALEYAPRVRVNGVAPGLVLPPAGKDIAYLQQLAHTNPLNRHGGEEDIVRAVVFLIESEFITGQTIFVDGGRHLKGRMYD